MQYPCDRAISRVNSQIQHKKWDEQHDSSLPHLQIVAKPWRNTHGQSEMQVEARRMVRYLKQIVRERVKEYS